jgi:hypothetical protein
MSETETPKPPPSPEPPPEAIKVQDDDNGIIHRDGKRTYWQRPKATVEKS